MMMHWKEGEVVVGVGCLVEMTLILFVLVEVPLVVEPIVQQSVVVEAAIGKVSKHALILGFSVAAVAATSRAYCKQRHPSSPCHYYCSR